MWIRIKFYSTNNFRQVLFSLLILFLVMHTVKVPFLVASVQLKMSERLWTRRK